GLLQHVVPERRLALPLVRQRQLAVLQRLDAEPARDRLAGGEPDAAAALEVADRERVEVVVGDVARDLQREIDQRPRQPAVDLLRTLRRLVAAQVEEQRQVDDAPRGHREEANEIGEVRILAYVGELVSVADMAVAVSYSRVII